MEATEHLLAALEAHGEALAAEMSALEEMPQVKLTASSVFDRATPPGTKAQLRGVICKLRCCGRQLDMKCNDLTGDRACPTHVEAARMLRAKVVEKHGSEECVAKARQNLAEEGGEQTAFSVMMSAQLGRQRADSELKQAEAELQSLQSKVAAAERRLEEAQAEAASGRWPRSRALLSLSGRRAITLSGTSSSGGRRRAASSIHGARSSRTRRRSGRRIGGRVARTACSSTGDLASWARCSTGRMGRRPRRRSI